MPITVSRVRVLLFWIAVAAASLTAPASAATWWWDTITTGLWTDGANWSNNATSGGTTGTLPTNNTTTDNVVFNQSSVNGDTIVQVSADRSIRGIVIANTGSTTLQSDSVTSRLLTLGADGIVVNAGAGAVTLGGVANPLNLALSVTGSINNNSSSLVTVNSNISRTASETTTRRITFGGTGNTVMNGVLSNGGASGTLEVFKSGTGTLRLAGANTFSGQANLIPASGNNGTVLIGVDSVGSVGAITSGAFGTGTIALTQGGSVTIAGNDSVTKRTILNPIVNSTFGGNLTFGDGVNNASIELAGGYTHWYTAIITNNLGGSGVLTMSGPVNVVDNGNRNLTITGTGRTVITGAISNAGSGYTGGLSLSGPGAVTLAAQNTYLGNTSLGGTATVRLGSSSIVQSGSIVSGPFGVGTVGAGGSGVVVTISGDDSATKRTVANRFNFDFGTFNYGDGVNDASLEFSGLMNSLYGGTQFNNNLASGTLTFSGTLSPNPTGGKTMTFAGDGRTEVTGVIVNGTSASSTASNVTKNGNGMLVMSGQNIYTGQTTLGAGVLAVQSAENVGVSGPMGIGGTIVLNGGTLQYSSANQFDYSSRFSTGGSQKYNVDTNGQNVTWATALTSSGGSLTKLGSGTLTLTGASTYAGATTVSAGVLATTGSNRLADGTNVAVASGATFRIGGYDAVGGLTGAGTLDLNGNELRQGLTASGTFSGAIVGSGTFGVNAQTYDYFITGSSSFTGVADLRGGTIYVGDDSAFGTAQIKLSTFSAATLASANSSTRTLSNPFGAGNATFGTPTTGNLVFTGTMAGGNIGTATVNNSLTQFNRGWGDGTFSRTKAGTGTLAIGGSSVYTGTTNVNAGTLQLGIGSTDGTLSLSSVITGSAGATFSVNRTNTVTQGVDFRNGVTGAINVSQVGSGTLVLSGTNTYTGTTSLAAGTLLVNSGSALAGGGSVTFAGGTLMYSGSNQADFASRIVGSSAAISIDTNGQNVTWSSPLANTNVGGLVKLGSGTLTLSSAATYTGQTQVSGGVLALGAGDVIPGQSSLLVNGGAFDLAGFNDTVGTVTLTSGSILGSGTLSGSSYALQGGRLNARLGAGGITVSTGTTTLGSAGRFDSSSSLTISSGQLTLSGNESVASYSQSGGTLGGSGTVTASTYDLGGGSVSATLGSGTVNVSGNSTLAGTSEAARVDLKAGSLTLGSGGNRFTSSSVVVTGSSGASMALGGAESFGSLAGAASIALGSFTLSVGSSSADSAYSGILSGAGGLTKVGNGAFELRGENTYTGPTTIASGTLLTGIANAISGSSAITIGSAGSRGFLEIDHPMSISSLTFTDQGGDISSLSTGTVTLSAASGTATITVLGGTNAFHANATLSSPTLVNVASGALFSFHNNLAGGASLTKSGAGTMQLVGDNDTLSGNLFITAGRVNVGAGMNQIGTGTTTLSGGSIIDLGGQSFTDRIIVVSGTILNAGGTATTTTIEGASTITGTTTLLGTYNITSTGSARFESVVGNGASIMNVNVNSGGGSGGQAVFANAVSAKANIVVASGGTATFNGDVSGAVISHGASTFNGAVLATDPVQVQAGGSASFAGATGTASTIAIASGGRASFAGSVAGQVTVSGSATFDVASSLTGRVYTDSTGVATLGNVAAIISAELHNDGQLVVNSVSGSQTVSGYLRGSGSILKQGAGTLVLTGGSNAFVGSTEIAAGKIQIGNGGTAGSLGGAITNNGELAFNRTDNYGGAYAGTITGSGLVRLLGGSLTLSSSNAYSGGTWIDGGTLTAGHVSAFGSGAITLASGATLDLNNLLVTNAITNNGGTIRGGVISGTVSGTSNISGGQTTFDSTIAGGARIDIDSTGTASFGNGAAIETGATIANNGVLRVNRSVGGALGFGSAVSGSGRFQVEGGIARLDATNTYSGNTVITGSGSVLKLGAAGSFANSPVIVVGDADSNNAILDLTAKSGTFAIGNGQTLKGGGTIQLAADGVFEVQGTFTPGNSPGLFTYDGGTTVLSGTTIMEILGTNRATLASHGTDPYYDAVNIINGGVLQFGGSLTFEFASLFGDNTSFDLFSPASGSSLAGNFTGVNVIGSFYTELSWTPSGSVWKSSNTMAGQSLEFNSLTGQLVIVPEPDAISLVVIGLGVTVWAARRRQRRAS